MGDQAADLVLALLANTDARQQRERWKHGNVYRLLQADPG